MKAVIMAGGQGTRLRPLSCDLPKPMVPIMNRPMLEHIIRLLKRHGFDEIALTLCHLPEAIENYLGDGARFGVKLHYFREDEPLGTAGSVRQATGFLDETFLVISGDALTDIDLTMAMEAHRAKKAAATIVLTRVASPLEYGVVLTAPDGRVQRFLEKPSWSEVFSDTVNTGIYVLEPEVMDHVPTGRAVDFSKDLFPLLLTLGAPLYGHIADGYWSDVGNLDEYRRGHRDALTNRVSLEIDGRQVSHGILIGDGAVVEEGAILTAPVLIGPRCFVEKGAKVGPYAVLGEGTTVRRGAAIQNTVVWDRSYVDERVETHGAVIADQVLLRPDCRVGEGGVVGRGSIIGERAIIKPAVKIWPEKRVEGAVVVSSSLVWGNGPGRLIFGHRGVSGIPNLELTPELLVRMSASFGSILPPGGRVIVGDDGAVTSRMAALAVMTGLSSVGKGVVDLGTVTVPVTRYAVRTFQVQGGVHIRLLSPASGRLLVEFLDERGLNLDRNRQRAVENAYSREDFSRAHPPSVGKIACFSDIIGQYLEQVVRLVDQTAISAGGFQVSMGCLPGELSLLAPALLERVGVQVRRVDRDEAGDDGLTLLERVARDVRENKSHLGLVVQEGAEDLQLIDEEGKCLPQDLTPVLFAYLVFTSPGNRNLPMPVTAPAAVDELARRFQGRITRTRVGPRAVMEKALDGKVLGLGDGGNTMLIPVFDAIITLAKLLETMAKKGATLSRLVAEIPPFHVRRRTVPCPWEAKGLVMRALMENIQNQSVDLTDGIKMYHDQGWALVLPDAEAPFFHIYSEGRTDAEAEELSERYAAKIAEVLSAASPLNT